MVSGNIDHEWQFYPLDTRKTGAPVAQLMPAFDGQLVLGHNHHFCGVIVRQS